MIFTDTHCHIHEADYPDGEAALSRAVDNGIERVICVGTDEASSRQAVAFADAHDHSWASVGLHPHDAMSGEKGIATLEELIVSAAHTKSHHQTRSALTDSVDHLAAAGKTESHDEILPDQRLTYSPIVAIGECGLDYFYDHSPRDKQIEMLHGQLQLAVKYDLPVIFHVRGGKDKEAFDDFWPIFDSYKGLRGVLHSFTDTMSNLEKGLSRGLYVGVNGISTFTKDEKQLEMYASIPVNRLVFETDAPFLTPIPKRGTVNEPAFITHIAQYSANLRTITLEELSRATERNATTLFF